MSVLFPEVRPFFIFCCFLKGFFFFCNVQRPGTGPSVGIEAAHLCSAYISGSDPGGLSKRGKSDNSGRMTHPAFPGPSGEKERARLRMRSPKFVEFHTANPVFVKSG